MIIANCLIIAFLLALANKINADYLCLGTDALFQMKRSAGNAQSLVKYHRIGESLEYSSQFIFQTGKNNEMMKIAMTSDESRLLVYSGYNSTVYLFNAESMSVIKEKKLFQNEKIEMLASVFSDEYVILSQAGEVYQLSSHSGEMKKLFNGNIAFKKFVMQDHYNLIGFGDNGDIYHLFIGKSQIKKLESVQMEPKFVATSSERIFVSDGRKINVLSRRSLSSLGMIDLGINENIDDLKAFEDDFSLVVKVGGNLKLLKLSRNLGQLSLVNFPTNPLYYAVNINGDVVTTNDGNEFRISSVLSLKEKKHEEKVLEGAKIPSPSQVNSVNKISGLKFVYQKLFGRSNDYVDFGKVYVEDFTDKGTTYEWTPPSWVASADILIVGGGGGGGGTIAAGGGAGGVLIVKKVKISGKYRIEVGNGGRAGGYYTLGESDGKPGGNSKFGLYQVLGGGGGHGYGPAAERGSDGGSGGGCAHTGNGFTGASRKISPVGLELGNNGGDCGTGSGSDVSGGGGGAATAGIPCDRNGIKSGDGGNGTDVSADFPMVGVNGYLAGGGGGGARRSRSGYGYFKGGKGGVGGGGYGISVDGRAEDGKKHTGSGGGGSGHYRGSTATRGGHGGSGIVVVRAKSSDGSQVAQLIFHHGNHDGYYGDADTKEASIKGRYYSDLQEKFILSFHHGKLDGSYSLVDQETAIKGGFLFSDMKKSLETNIGKFSAVQGENSTTYYWDVVSPNGNAELLVDLLVVGGGGGGGQGAKGIDASGAGGGAGGVLHKPAVKIAATGKRTEIVVGAGGRGSRNGLAGGDGHGSKILLFSVSGGGGGGSAKNGSRDGRDGASGGGSVLDGVPGEGIQDEGNVGGSSGTTPGTGGGFKTRGFSGSRYKEVKLQMTRNDWLNLAEIQIFDQRGINIANVAKLTSSSWHGSYPLSRLVNGDKRDLSHSGNHYTPWVHFNFTNPVSIRNIVIYNRYDCCRSRILGSIVSAIPESSQDSAFQYEIIGATDIYNIQVNTGPNGKNFSTEFDKIYGEDGYFGGGGGFGKQKSILNAAGGLGGGASGDDGQGIKYDGSSHTGGGGGGGASFEVKSDSRGGDGGSGIVMIKVYKVSALEDTASNSDGNISFADTMTNFVLPAAGGFIAFMVAANVAYQYQQKSKQDKMITDPFMGVMKEIISDEEWNYNPDYERKIGEINGDFEF